MKKFNIYHSTGINKFKEVENQERIYVGDVKADSLEEAYMLSQNQGDGDEWNATNPCRSTSVGDVIQGDDGFYMVCGTGFKLLDDMSKNESELNSLENQTNEC
jgi:hypothetical protein